MNTTTNAVAAAFASINIEVSKKEGAKGSAKFVKVGDVTIFCPTLESISQPFERQVDAEGKEVVEDGLPVYKSAEHNWLQGAMLAQVKAQARNKLISGTATLKDGASIATDWETLTAEAEGRGNGEALQARRDVINLFEVYVKGLGKSEKAQTTLNQLFKNKESLSLQSPENKAKMEQYVTNFAETLDEAQTARFMKHLEGIVAACAETTEAEDF